MPLHDVVPILLREKKMRTIIFFLCLLFITCISCGRKPAEKPADDSPNASESRTNLDINTLRATAQNERDAKTASGLYARISSMELAKGDIPSAIKDGEKSRSLNGSSPEAALFLGRAYLDAGRISQAGVELARALSLEPHNAAAHSALAGCLVKQGKTGEAMKEYASAVRLDGSDIEALNNLAVLNFRSGNPAGAEKLLLQALDKKPSFAPAMKNLAILYEKGIRDKEKALRYYRLYRNTISDEPSRRVADLWISALGG
jgi:Flp pilus assembly protein TadD